MQKEIMTQSINAGKACLEALPELNSITRKCAEQLNEIQFKLASLGIDSSVDRVKLITTLGNFKDLLAKESELASQYSKQILQLAREIETVLNSCQDEITAWVEKTLQAASSAAREAA